MAQDFRAAFGLGASDKVISMVDADGISLLGFQAFAQANARLERENAAVRDRLAALESAVHQLQRTR